MICTAMIGWDGTYFSVPVIDRNRHVTALARARIDWRTGQLIPVPLGSERPRLFGESQLAWGVERLYIVEGIGEALVLISRGFHAVASTGDGLEFLPEWVPIVSKASEVIVCLSRRPTSLPAAFAIRNLLPQVRIVTLPTEVGGDGGLYDYFVRLGRSEADFARHIATADKPENDA